MPLPTQSRDVFLHELLDDRMINYGNSAIFTFAHSSVEIPMEISFLEFGRAAHRAAYHVRSDQSRGVDNEIVAIISHIDSILYHALTMGIMRAGLTPFPIAHRNSPAGVMDMLMKIGCRRILTTPPGSNTSTDALISTINEISSDEWSLTIEHIPTFNQLYPYFGHESILDPFDPYPSKPRLMSDTALYLHSSGSTGFPKPIPLKFEFLSIGLKSAAVTGRWDHNPPIRKFGIFGMPPFHAYGFSVEVQCTLGSGLGVCIFPPAAMLDQAENSANLCLKKPVPPLVPTSDNIIEHVKLTNPDVLATVPSFIDIWATEKDNKKIALLKKMQYVIFAGGALPFEKGQYLVDQGIKLRNVYGGTEMVPPVVNYVVEDPDFKYWDYVKFSERTTIEWVPQQNSDDAHTENTVYELRLLKSDTFDVAAVNFRHKEESQGQCYIREGYSTSDLFQKHPSLDLWKIVGRLDDVIVLSSGEKAVPGPIEETITAHPLIKSAVMFGREREHVGVLIEPVSNIAEQDKTRFIERIWTSVEAATARSPSFSRIFKEMILLVNPSKPVVRADKGTVKKKATISLYKEEIDALYEQLRRSDTGVTPPMNWSEKDIRDWLTLHARDVVSRQGSSKIFEPDRNLFEQGFDSLSATFLRNRIVSALEAGSELSKNTDISKALPFNIIYLYPTLSNLASRIALLIATGYLCEEQPHDIIQRAQMIEEIIAEFSRGLPGIVHNPAARPLAPDVVLLTGTTGNLGSFLLASLLQNQNIEKVYAYNRPGRRSSKKRQIDAFKDRDLSLDLLDSNRVVFLEGDLSKEKLSLEPLVYEEIRYNITAIIHNAWKLDFNLPLALFRPYLAGTRNLINLALDSPNAAFIRFLFTSSISTAQSWPRSNGSVPEEVLVNSQYAVGSGYGEGKYICERVIEKSGLQATSFRIGQMTGPVPNGAWAPSDWVPLMIKSSVSMGVFPDTLGKVTWIPVNVVSAAILDVFFSYHPLPPVLSIVHPKPMEWTKILSMVREEILQSLYTGRKFDETSLPMIPLSDWLKQLERVVPSVTEGTIMAMPALKLLGFFRFFAEHQRSKASEIIDVVTDIKEIKRLSGIFNDVKPLGDDDVRAWVRYWRSKGMLD